MSWQMTNERRGYLLSTWDGSEVKQECQEIKFTIDDNIEEYVETDYVLFVWWDRVITLMFFMRIHSSQCQIYLSLYLSESFPCVMSLDKGIVHTCHVEMMILRTEPPRWTHETDWFRTMRSCQIWGSHRWRANESSMWKRRTPGPLRSAYTATCHLPHCHPTVCRLLRSTTSGHLIRASYYTNKGRFYTRSTSALINFFF